MLSPGVDNGGERLLWSRVHFYHEWPDRRPKNASAVRAALRPEMMKPKQ
jgi:hypothetical protein